MNSASQEGLVDHQFSWWRSELKKRAAESETAREESQPTKSTMKKHSKRPQSSPTTSFVPVQIESSSLSQASLEIVLDQPPRIKVTSGFNADLLREVVHVLESR